MSDHTLKIYNQAGDSVLVPAKNTVCSTCDGKGSHVNRAIDGNGLDDHLADDPDFMESYMGGVYDVPCEECKGNKIVLAYDCDQMTLAQLEQVDAHETALANDRAEQLAELRFCGCM